MVMSTFVGSIWLNLPSISSKSPGHLSIICGCQYTISKSKVLAVIVPHLGLLHRVWVSQRSQ